MLDFMTKWDKRYYKDVQLFCIIKWGKQYCKVGQVLQSTTIVRKQGSAIYLSTNNLSLRIPEKLKFVTIITKKKNHPPPATDVFASLASLKNNPVRRVRKLPITGSEFSYVASEASLYVLSLLNIFLRLLTPKISK